MIRTFFFCKQTANIANNDGLLPPNEIKNTFTLFSTYFTMHVSYYFLSKWEIGANRWLQFQWADALVLAIPFPLNHNIFRSIRFEFMGFYFVFDIYAMHYYCTYTRTLRTTFTCFSFRPTVRFYSIAWHISHEFQQIIWCFSLIGRQFIGLFTCSCRNPF